MPCRIPAALLVVACSLAPALVRGQAQTFDEAFETIKKQASPAELYRFLHQMPKGGDLHHHLGLSFLAEDLWDAASDPSINKGNEFFTRLRVSTCANDATPALRFANIQRSAYDQLSACEKSDYAPLKALTPDQREAWLSALKLDRPREGRNEFFEAAVIRASGLTRNIEILDHLLRRMLTRLGRENIRYVESQTGFTGMVDNQGVLLGPSKYAERLRAAAQSEEVKSSGVTIRFQAVAIRFAPEAESHVEEAYKLVAANRDIFVGVNMAGREDNEKGHAARFLPVFRELRRKYSGVRLSIHAGEKNSPGHEVRDTLLLGAERIGHGFNLIHDPDTMLRLRNGKNLVEVSLVSNHLLEYSPDPAKHPFIEYLRYGIPVCLNTDDAGSWDSQLTDDYFLAVKHFDLTWDEVVRLGRDSLNHAFVDEREKARLLTSFDAAVAQFEQRMQSRDWRQALNSAPVSGYAQRNLGIR